MSRSSGCPGSLKARPGVVFHIISADFTKLFHAFVRPLFELRSLTAAQRQLEFSFWAVRCRRGRGSREEGGRVPLPPGMFVVSCPTGQGRADSLPQARCAGTRFTAFRAVPLARLLGPVTDCVQLQDLCMMHGIKKSPVRPAGSCVQGAEPVLLAGFPEAEASVKLAVCNSFLQ